MKTTSHRLAVIAILSFALPTVAQTQRKPDAASIMNNMYRLYSRLASYQDEGILVSTHDEPTGGTIEKIPFKTFFKRPNLFRFEWTEFNVTKLGRKKLVWFNGKEAFMYWEPDYYEKEQSLSMAVAGASDISPGAVNTVSTMLSDEFGSWPMKRLKRSSLLGEDMVDGVRCFHLKATEDEDPIELWVGKSDFLLRKTRRETKDGDVVRIREEIHRNIQIDQAIAEVAFNYKPPIPLSPPKEVNTAEIDKLLNPGPPEWTEFRSEEGRFAVLMPEKPTSQTSTFEFSQGRLEEHVFTAAHRPLVCLVTYTDFPKPMFVTGDSDGLFGSVRDQFIKEMGGKLASENPLTLDGYPGREIKIAMFRGEVRVRMFLVGERLYLLALINMEKPFASDEEANKFFASFKLNSATKTIAARRKPITARRV